MNRPWNDIRRLYVDLTETDPRLQAMVNLVEHIETSHYVSGLYAWTSMHDLCIAQTPVTYPYNGPYLRIAPLFDGNVDFRYIDTAKTEKQWHRVVREEDAFRRLEQFVTQLNWFGRQIAPRA